MHTFTCRACVYMCLHVRRSPALVGIVGRDWAASWRCPAESACRPSCSLEKSPHHHHPYTPMSVCPCRSSSLTGRCALGVRRASGPLFTFCPPLPLLRAWDNSNESARAHGHTRSARTEHVVPVSVIVTVLHDAVCVGAAAPTGLTSGDAVSLERLQPAFEMRDLLCAHERGMASQMCPQRQDVAIA